MKCFGNAEETVGSSARDVSHKFLPGPWSLRGILSGGEFYQEGNLGRSHKAEGAL